MKLLIGCPIYKRDWIFDHWMACIIRQSINIKDIGIIFEASSNDAATLQKIELYKSQVPFAYFSVKIREDLPHFEHKDNGRQWTLSKYANMVSLRNSLLESARELNPDFYFSLDSDILIQNPNTLELLMGHIKDGADAVNPLMFMTPVGTQFPSVMTWRGDNPEKATRKSDYPIGSFFEADVIMAAKMMSKSVYKNVDYDIHLQGEDLGWSLNAKNNGYKLFCASYIYAPHIMSPLMYEDFLKNGDARKEIYQLV